MIEVVKATPELVKQFLLQGDVRERDAYEWLILSNGRKLSDALLARDPKKSWAAVDEEGYVLALWGFAPHGPYTDDHLVGWLIGTNRGTLRAREIHRKRKAIMAEVKEVVHAYTIYREDKWHALLGFTHQATLPFPGGMGPDIFIYHRRVQWAH